jgi:Fe/S biogenesis protein NfuA
LSIIGRGREGFRYEFRIVSQNDQRPDDSIADGGTFVVFIDATSAPLMKGSVLDVREDGFKVNNPNPVWTDEKGPRVLEVIDGVINPGLAMHGGRISLVDVRDDVVYITFGGGCQGCGMATMTLSEGVYKLIQEAVPGIQDVVDVTQHSLGTNPYFRPQSPLQSSSSQES